MSEVIITPQILARNPRGYTQEFDLAYQRLLDGIEQNSPAILQAICDAAWHYCRAETAGLCRSGYLKDEPVLNWEIISGEVSSLGRVQYSPREGTPWGTAIEMYSYQVFHHPERHYRWLSENNLVIPEMIVMPIYRDDHQPLGTFWVVHAAENHFDQEDVRVISILLSLINKAMNKAIRSHN